MSTLYESVNDLFDKLPVKIYKHNLQGEYIWAPLHWHRSIELLVSFQGHNCMSIGGNDFVFTEDDWTIINSSELHSSRYLTTKDTFVGISVIISLPFIEEWIGKNVMFYNPGRKAVTEIIQKLAMDIYHLKEDSAYYALKVMSKTMEILLVLAEYCVKENVVYKIPFNKSGSKGNDFLRYIEENYRQTFSLNDIADYFQYTPSYFSRFFKELVGVNFYSYLNYVRVHHATKMLLEGDTTLTDCALLNGFPNVKSFISMFKRIHGCTPGAFLKKRSL
ncbi:MAG TPA: AraC family transcriptional regulator [Lachnospiraceae bacterium]